MWSEGPRTACPPRLVWLAAAALLVAFGATSCSTTDRVWRISPLAREGSSSPERVNLWPLAYHDRDATSVLWPLFDIDDSGFALRPLVSKDGSTWNVLWPLARWHTVRDEGWVVPWYRSEKNSGLFPIANLGSLSWIGPVWWKHDDSGEIEARGLFPIVHLGRLRYAGPAWWTDDGWGLFPLAGAGFFGVNHVGPVAWVPGESTFGLFPLFLWANGGERVAVLPIYAHYLSDGSQSRYYLLGLAGTRVDGEREQSWIFPIWYSDEEPGEVDRVLFPVYYRRERGDAARVFTLLGDARNAPEGSSVNIYPLWWSSNSENESWRMLLPVFYWREKGDARTLLTPLGGRGWSASGETHFVNVLGPLFHRSRAEDGSESRTAILWPLLERHREDDETTMRVLPFYTHRATPVESETSFALGLGHRQSSATGGSWRVFPLAALSRGEKQPDLLYSLTLYGEHSLGGETRRHLFPLCHSRTSDHEAESRLLLGLAGWERSQVGSEWHVWPLIARSSEVPGNGFRSSHTRLLLFFQRLTEDRPEDGYVPHSSDCDPSNLVSMRSHGFLFDLFHSKSIRYRHWPAGLLGAEDAEVLHRWSSSAIDWSGGVDPRDPARARAILRAHHAPVTGYDDDSVASAVRAFAAEHAVNSESRRLHLPLLYRFDRDDDRVEWHGPLWIIDHDHDTGSSRTSVLWYGYRSETVGERTSRDIFPFITCDTAPTETTVSFLWRLFRYERRGDRRGGHVFFIPWGAT